MKRRSESRKKGGRGVAYAAAGIKNRYQFTEELLVPREEVETIHRMSQSLMPDGLMTQLSDDQVRDLIAYLQTTSQVSLPQTGRRYE